MPRPSRFDAELRLPGRATATLCVPAAALIGTARRCHRFGPIVYAAAGGTHHLGRHGRKIFDADGLDARGDTTARRGTVDHNDSHDLSSAISSIDAWHVARVTAADNAEDVRGMGDLRETRP